MDLEAVKGIQQTVWAKGDFAMIAATMASIGDSLCDATDVTPGERVLDVACGSGNVAIAAARRFAEVTGVDYVPALLEHGRERMRVEGLTGEFVEGDAEALPFEDASFDVVLSTFGSMFAPDQQRAADELLRVCRPGGRIGMGNWTPEGGVGEMFAITAKHAPPPVKLDPPVLWGTEARLEELFGDRVSSMSVERKHMAWRYRSFDHWLSYFRKWFGPTQMAFERVGEEGAEALAADLREVLTRRNTAGDRALVVPCEYLEVVAVRAG